MRVNLDLVSVLANTTNGNHIPATGVTKGPIYTTSENLTTECRFLVRGLLQTGFSKTAVGRFSDYVRVKKTRLSMTTATEGFFLWSLIRRKV
jgi:hypothetical protein